MNIKKIPMKNRRVLQAAMRRGAHKRVRTFGHLLERVRTFVQILARTSKGFALLVKVRKGFALLGICSPTPRKGSHFWRRFANGSHFCAFSGLGAKGSQFSNASGTKQIVKNRASIFVAFCLHKFIIKMQVLGRSCGGALLVKILQKGSRFSRSFAHSGKFSKGFALLAKIRKGFALLCRS